MDEIIEGLKNNISYVRRDGNNLQYMISLDKTNFAHYTFSTGPHGGFGGSAELPISILPGTFETDKWEVFEEPDWIEE